MPEMINKEDDVARFLFHRGENFTAYRYLGAHRAEDGSVTFRVWAPAAEKVFLVSDTLGWQTGEPFEKISDEGIWLLQISRENAPEGMRYKFRILSQSGEHFKADPYAFFNETSGNTASILYTEKKYHMTDGEWMKKRREKINGSVFYPYPLNIYEAHLASFMTKDGKSNEKGDAYLNYRELAEKMASYLIKMGYTHLELLPITEYPYDGSWGYQVTGFFSPTSRFGTPDDFRYFVDYMHQKGIGVILDFVPAHFPKDEHGLFEFDGGPLYEYSDPTKMEQPSWGTRCFDVGRNEVRSFLISSAMYWVREYHIDGLRIDAVAAMLYLDYDRKPGEWVPNIYGSNINLESVEFFKRLNGTIHGEYPDVLTIAEESTAFPKITGKIEEDGLGFSLKWNMGWSNDMFRYLSCDPIGRQYHHAALTFPIMYAYSERYVLPVSHDEVVHGKCSLIGKMAGDYQMKFDGMRSFLLFQMTFPGKKLLFMGTEFGQFREWDFQNQLEWFMLKYPAHKGLQNFTAMLNKYYVSEPALYEDDFRYDGFKWIYPDLAALNMVAYTRRALDGREVHIVLNFSGVERKNFWVEVPEEYSKYKTVFSTQMKRFGGKALMGKVHKTFNHKGKNYIRLNIPALSGLVIKGI